MARICLVTPGHLSTNPRVVKEADALSKSGHHVRVIAADYLRWARAADAEFGSRRWRVEKLKFGPQAPLSMRMKQAARQRSARLCAKLGIRGEAIDSAAWHPIGPDLLEAARRTPADLYIAHYVAALPAAAHAAKLNGALYAFDAEDFHLGDLPDMPQHTFEKRLIRTIEGRYLPGCAFMTAASRGIADAYASTYGIPRPTVVLNVFPPSQGVEAPTAKGTASPGPSIYWFSQTIGRESGIGMCGPRHRTGEIKPASLSAGRRFERFFAPPWKHCERSAGEQSHPYPSSCSPERIGPASHKI